jgi:ABC-type nitrate/sulfonate/bicarbonate transport system ATPase subunit
VIDVTDVTFAYNRDEPVFRGFNWQTARGQAWTILGPSGCGKSTLLALLAGLLLPQSGEVRIDGQPLERPRPRTGLIIQDYGLVPWATVRENARLGLRVRNFYGPDNVHAPRDYTRTLDVDSWLDRLGLLPFADQFPAQISGGQRQRTAIARTLALEPDLLLMDEPFSSLDAPTRESLQRLVLELWQEHGLTLITVTHMIEEAAVLGEHILLLNQPPNLAPVVIENPHILQLEYRESPVYHELVHELRVRLETA